MKTSLSLDLTEKEIIRNKTAKPMLYFAIGSMVMLFAGMTSAYVVRLGQGNWLKFDMPQIFYFSTAVILICSVTINWAVQSAKKDELAKVRNALLLTLLLGITFIVFQVIGWNHLTAQKIFFAGKDSNASGSFFYVITGMHLAHLIGGILYLLAVTVKSFNKKYNSKNYLSLQLCATYWHFLDGLWIYLFFFLLLIS